MSSFHTAPAGKRGNVDAGARILAAVISNDAVVRVSMRRVEHMIAFPSDEVARCPISPIARIDPARVDWTGEGSPRGANARGHVRIAQARLKVYARSSRGRHDQAFSLALRGLRLGGQNFARETGREGNRPALAGRHSCKSIATEVQWARVGVACVPSAIVAFTVRAARPADFFTRDFTRFAAEATALADCATFFFGAERARFTSR